MKPRAGELDRPITIQQRGLSSDTDGAPVEGWTTWYDTFAKVNHLSSAEILATRGFHSIRIARFDIRNIGTPLETMQILYESQTWRIIGIAEIDRGWGWSILAEVVK